MPNALPRLFAGLAAMLFASSSWSLAAGSVPNCGPDVKPGKFVSLDEYSPHPCESTGFSVQVELTVTIAGKAADVTLLRPAVLPPDKRECIADKVRNWLTTAARFSRPAAQCRYRLRVTSGPVNHP